MVYGNLCMKKAFKDMKAGTLKEIFQVASPVKVGSVRVIIQYSKDDRLVLEGPIKKNYDLIDLAEISEEE